MFLKIISQIFLEVSAIVSAEYVNTVLMLFL